MRILSAEESKRANDYAVNIMVEGDFLPRLVLITEISQHKAKEEAVKSVKRVAIDGNNREIIVRWCIQINIASMDVRS